MRYGRPLHAGHAPFSIPVLYISPGSSWGPSQVDRTDLSLVQYFYQEAALAISCDLNGEAMAGNITRLAFHDDSPSSQAVLHAVLAVSSLCRQGNSTETIKRQGKALQALEQSAKSDLAGLQIAQHVAANNLLCCFEIFGRDQTAGPWYMYVAGAKSLLRASPLHKSASSELIAMAGWLHHHDVHASFGLKHWRRAGEMSERTTAHSLVKGSLRENTKSMKEMVKQVPEDSEYAMQVHAILWPLADIFEDVVDSSHPLYHDPAYREGLRKLEVALESTINGRYVEVKDRKDFSVLHSTEDLGLATLETYRLAALIYLERSSTNFSGRSAKLDAWADEAIKLLCTIGSNKHGFPLFVVGCEARTDEQRVAILECIEKAQGRHPFGRLLMLEEMLHSAWALMDLETEQDVNYLAMLDVVVSGCETMPSFS
ncbi:fungal specific transcription factor domain-containing protein [Sarocladium implicatum]|nr:fungal specific transcription factor domain-containing protein [Sarocladium implicatum]